MSSNNSTNPQTRTINSTIASAGQTAGNLVSGVGSTVDKAGRNLNDGVSGVGSSGVKGVSGGVAKSTHNWGDSTREFGNQVRDAAGAGGARSQTANNPLGLSGQKGPVGGRKQTVGNPLGLGGKYK